MIVWAIANQKGGVGKTTTTVSLGGLLAARGNRTLLVDSDPHGSMSVYFGHDPDSLSGGVYDLFQQDRGLDARKLSSFIRKTDFENMDLLPASTAMAALDRQMGTREGMGLVFSRSFKLLAESYDYILIDCPPLLGILMVNALAVCDRLLIPVQTEFLALKGLDRMIHTLSMIMRSRGGSFDYTVVPTLYDKRTNASVSALEVLQQNHAEHLWQGFIPVDTQFREASRRGLPINKLTPGSRGTVAYTRLLDYLLGGHMYLKTQAVMS